MTKLKGLLLTEGMHGMISQVEGLAKALDLEFIHEKIELNNFWKMIPPKITPIKRFVFKNDILEYNLNKITTLILNQSEGEGLSNEKIPNKILKVLNNNFKNTEIILTLGEKGSLYSYKDELIKIRAHDVKTVDTTGAGDTFIGYYVAGFASKMNKKDNLNRASEAAALTTLKLGGGS